MRPNSIRAVSQNQEITPASDLWQSRRLEFVKGSKPYGAAGIDRAPRPGFPSLAGGGCFPLTPSLSLGERVSPFDPRRTVQTRRLSTARCALFPLPEGEGQGEGKRRQRPARVRTNPGTVELYESSCEAGGFPTWQ